MTIKHSVVMITYNQEIYIRKALDSILNEKVQPYEIIIGDDYSVDGTRNILEEYKTKYPEIIKLILNEKNLGIFANLNNITHLPSGDMIHFLSGDDWYKPGFLENVNNKIEEMNLVPSCSRFILLPDVVLHYQNESEKILKNEPRLIAKFSPSGLVIRDLVQWRQVGLSRALFDRWPLFPEDSEEVGPWSDRIQHVMLAQHIEMQIVMDCLGAVYRVGVGIASKTKQEELELSYCKALKHLHLHYQKGELNISKKDAYYILFLIKCAKVKIKFEIKYFIGILLDSARIIFLNFDEIYAVKPQVSAVIKRSCQKNFIGRLVRVLRSK